jgi:hypothetical protein
MGVKQKLTPKKFAHVIKAAFLSYNESCSTNRIISGKKALNSSLYR